MPHPMAQGLTIVLDRRQDGRRDRRKFRHWLGKLPGAGQAKCKGVPHSKGPSERPQVHLQFQWSSPACLMYSTRHGTITSQGQNLSWTLHAWHFVRAVCSGRGASETPAHPHTPLCMANWNHHVSHSRTPQTGSPCMAVTLAICTEQRSMAGKDSLIWLYEMCARSDALCVTLQCCRGDQ